MSNRVVTCITCPAKKEIFVHKKGYVGPESVQVFQMDGWVFLKGKQGICPKCPRLHLEVV